VAEAALKRMLKQPPWPRDYARLLGLSLMPGLTREFPFLGQPTKALVAKTRHTDAPGRAERAVAVSKHGQKTAKSYAIEPWVKPATTPSFEYRYIKQRYGAVLRSEYVGRENSLS
jgi:hypothetical protein